MYVIRGASHNLGRAIKLARDRADVGVRLQSQTVVTKERFTMPRRVNNVEVNGRERLRPGARYSASQPMECRIEIAAFVISVTSHTGLGVQSMKAFFVFNKSFYLFMAFEAFTIRYTFSSIMTFKAILTL